MKKIILLIIVFNSYVFYAQTTAIPDPNFEQALIDLGHDTVLDGSVVTANISGISNLNLIDKNISNLSGLENFVGLQGLYLTGNPISSLDVSNLTGLVTLFAPLTNISSLNVSQNTLLNILNLENTLISTLDLSSNLTITQLNCRGTNLTDLDISLNTNIFEVTARDMPNLEMLNVANGNNEIITSFNALSCPNLSCILVDDKSSADLGLNSYNSWFKDTHSFYLENTCDQTYVPDDNFEQVLIDFGYDDVLDNFVITDNITNVEQLFLDYKGISDLTGIEGFTNLKLLLARSNNLTSVDLSNNLLLEEFNLIANSITTIDLSQNTALKKVNLSSNNIASINTNALVNLEFLYLISNPITAMDFSTNTKLKIINLSNAQLASVDITMLPDLEILSLNTNSLTSLDASQNLLLKNLEVGYNAIVAINLSPLANLERLQLRGNPITTIDFSNNLMLRFISMHQTQLTTIDVTMLPLLEALYLNDNYLSSIDVSQNPLLSVFYARRNALTTINFSNAPLLNIVAISGNMFTNLDFSQNGSLTNVQIYDNPLLTEVFINNNANTLITTFNTQNSPMLDCIIVDDALLATNGNAPYDLWLKDVTASYCEVIAIPDSNFEQELVNLGLDDTVDGLLTRTQSVLNTTTLDLSSKNISNLQGIQAFSGLEHLNLDNNSLTSLDVKLNTNLITLDIGQNTITNLDVLGLNQLTSIKAFGNSLTSLDLSQLSALEVINIGSNQLSSLDISSNTMLKDVRINNNPISSLDITSNIGLEVLQIINCPISILNLENNNGLTQFLASGTNITAFDLSSKINLNDLDVSNNILISLDIKNGNNASLLTANFTNNTLLTCINVDDASVADSNTNWSKDATSMYSENCEALTYIPDLNFEQALIDLGIDTNTAPDSQVTTSAISSLISLDVSGKSIADLTGIEAFSSLQYLNASNNSISNILLSENNALLEVNLSGNSLTSIDVSILQQLSSFNISSNALTLLDVSQNTVLESLSCAQNNISSIDISFNILLKNLNLSENNMQSIDISMHSLLEDFDISNNALTTLDISLNTSLINLNVASNQFDVNLNLNNGNQTNLLSVDLTNNTDLFCINISDPVSASNNTNWLKDDQANYSVDCYALTYIPDDEFEFLTRLYAYDNPRDGAFDDYVPTAAVESIKILNFGTEITDITGLEAFINLEELYIGESSTIQTLDLTTNIKLKKLYISSNASVSTLNVTSNILLEELFVSASNSTLTGIDLTQNTTLKRLTLFNHNLSSLDVSQNFQLEHLEVNNNNLSVITMPVATQLRSLAVSNNQLTTLDLSGTNGLQTVYLQNNLFSILDLSASTLSLEIINCNDNPNLERINLKGSGYSTNIDIFSATNAPILNCVRVTHPDLAVAKESWVVDDITVYTQYCDDELTYVPDDNFEQHLIDEGMDDTPLDDYVPTEKINTVENLFMYEKGVSDLTGIEGFVNLITLHTPLNNLTTVDLSNNVLLENILLYNNQLTSLDLSNNINLKGILIGNFGSASLNQCEVGVPCEVDDVVFDENGNPISANPLNLNNIQNLDLSNNPLLETAYIFNMGLNAVNFGNNTNLRKIWSFHNNLSELDISQNSALEELMLNYNNIASLDASQNPQLTLLNISGNSIDELNLKNGNNSIMLGSGFVSGFGAVNVPNLFCVQVDDIMFAEQNWTTIDSQIGFSEDCSAKLASKVFLQGPSLNPNSGEENLMRDDIRVSGALPITSPYADGLTCDSTIFNIIGNNAIVDWIELELRDANDNLTVIERRSAFLQRDGDIVDIDGVSLVNFNSWTRDYYLSVKHRNHLGILTANALTFLHTGTSVDFTDANNQITFGANAQSAFGVPNGLLAMWGGNVNGDGVVRYQGADNDTNAIKDAILADSDNTNGSNLFTYSAYEKADVNLDLSIKYQGSGNDSNVIKDIILSHPNNQTTPSNLFTIEEQLPENN